MLPASALICREFHDRIVAALAAALERSYEKLSYRSSDPITPSIRIEVPFRILIADRRSRSEAEVHGGFDR